MVYLATYPKILIASIVLLLCTCQPAKDAQDAATLPIPTPDPTVRRVLIISIDGLRPGAISQAPMLTLLGLMQEGAYTLSAQTITPSSTLPSHTSMLTGLCPSQHGVTWNEYLPKKGYANGIDLFDLAHADGLETAMIVGKERLRHVTEPASTDVFEYVDEGDNLILEQAIGQIQQEFGLLFVHFISGDRAGHDYGWLSDEQLDAFRKIDSALAELLAALDDSGLQAETLVIVTADHGGNGRKHDASKPEDMTIPWIVHGPGVIPMQLIAQVHTTDTAATAAWALGLSIPLDWAGRPVTEAFGMLSLPRPEVICP